MLGGPRKTITFRLPDLRSGTDTSKIAFNCPIDCTTGQPHLPIRLTTMHPNTL
ncbi:hypothetical protein PoB_006285300 [Plakobranchus ocellatus]|uniref:Uncharacterized protein n=1 Tax=Plakobranchus ocellatus TaxID=259542 RepID=A0AAV4CWS9_9GAST|nr:hypothetical protein PoB_006285300 [Plakobranchus ocellatus]